MKKIKNNKNGFTLVEIIVVLVIVAILAAATIPTMLKFVDKAKDSEENANARSVFLAAQSVASENMAASDDGTFDPDDTTYLADVKSLSGNTGMSDLAVDADDGKTITKITYTSSNGKTVTIDAGKNVKISD